MVVLWHVTSRERANCIMDEGFCPTMYSEYGLDLLDQENIEDFDIEMSDELLAREAFEYLLDEHSNATFFWPTEEQALETRSAMNSKARYTGTVYDILEVDSEKIPCECKAGPHYLAEELFGWLEMNPELAGIIWGGNEVPEEMKELEEALDLGVEEYRERTESLNELDPATVYEVFCQCMIPKKAVIRRL